MNRLKIVSFLCALLFLLSACSLDDVSDVSNENINAFHEVDNSDDFAESSSDISDTSSLDISESIPEVEIAIDAAAYGDIPCAGVYRASTLEPIFEKNAFEKRSPASLTKLVTASVALKYSTVNRVYTVGTELMMVASDSSVCGIKQGQEISLGHLLTGLLMCSGNDAAYTIAVNIARSVSGEQLEDEAAVEYFCGLMNDFCATIGVTESKFMSPDGYEAEGQVVTVSDLAKIAKYAIGEEVIMDISSTPKKTVTIFSGETFEWNNSNNLLHENYRYYNPDVTGLKTGSTSAAGKCLITTVTVNEIDYIIVVLGCANEEQRYGLTYKLIEDIKNG